MFLTHGSASPRPTDHRRRGRAVEEHWRLGVMPSSRSDETGQIELIAESLPCQRVVPGDSRYLLYLLFGQAVLKGWAGYSGHLAPLDDC